MRDFRELIVWQKAHELTLEVYRVTANFPSTELYSLTSQIRRACSSIPMNIAEGCGRDGNAEFARFLWIAMGSSSELDYQLVLARDLTYLDPTAYSQLNDCLIEVRRMLNSLIQKVKTTRQPLTTNH